MGYPGRPLEGRAKRPRKGPSFTTTGIGQEDATERKSTRTATGYWKREKLKQAYALDRISEGGGNGN